MRSDVSGDKLKIGREEEAAGGELLDSPGLVSHHDSRWILQLNQQQLHKHHLGTRLLLRNDVARNWFTDRFVSQNLAESSPRGLLFDTGCCLNQDSLQHGHAPIYSPLFPLTALAVSHFVGERARLEMLNIL
jgi:hypothetical protein